MGFVLYWGGKHIFHVKKKKEQNVNSYASQNTVMMLKNRKP